MATPANMPNMPNQTASKSLIVVPPESTLGPAMRALTDNQKRFVLAMVACGGMDKTLAARRAGYSGTDVDSSAARVAGHRLSSHPKVQAAIKEEADRTIRTGGILASNVLIHIAQTDGHKDQFKAAVELLNRSGLQVITQHKMTVEHEDSESRAEYVKLIVQIAKMTGMDANKILGESPIDAEFEPVPEPLMSSEGLEDILG